MSSAKIVEPSAAYTVDTSGPNGRVGSVARANFGVIFRNSAAPRSSARFASAEAWSSMSSSANATRARFTAAAAARVSSGLKRRPDAVASALSGPAIASNTTAQSAALRAIGPILSSVHDSAIAPCRLTSPYVGRRPVTPQYADGVPIEPEVSDPSAYATRPPATAAPEPLDGPPAHRSTFHGLRPGPWSDALGYR